MNEKVNTRKTGADERSFQKWVKDEVEELGLFVFNMHPGLGMVSGPPDIWIHGPYRNQFVPLELKLWEPKGELYSCSPIRPDQIRWARKFNSYGGKVGLLMGMRQPDGWALALPHYDIWSKGVTDFTPDQVLLPADIKSAIELTLMQ